jgi:hypothetical protein
MHCWRRSVGAPSRGRGAGQTEVMISDYRAALDAYEKAKAVPIGWSPALDIPGHGRAPADPAPFVGSWPWRAWARRRAGRHRPGGSSFR